jgi:nickel/cobalt transporter (NiCoT) family protein
LNFSFFGLALLLGFRHGMDADHLAAIDGLVRIRNNRWNGVLFAFGHALIVTLLAAGIGRLSAVHWELLSPWLLIAIGTVNLYRLLRNSGNHGHYRLLTSSPILLGIIFAAGFETASQLSALALANQKNAWQLGAAFGLGMMIVDGFDGYNASLVQNAGNGNSARGQRASRNLSILVIIASYALAAAELAKLDIDRFTFPIGVMLFVAVFSLRISSRQLSNRAKPSY